MKLVIFAAAIFAATSAMADEATIYQSPSGSTYTYFYRDPQPYAPSAYEQELTAHRFREQEEQKREIFEMDQRNRDSWEREQDDKNRRIEEENREDQRKWDAHEVETKREIDRMDHESAEVDRKAVEEAKEDERTSAFLHDQLEQANARHEEFRKKNELRLLGEARCKCLDARRYSMPCFTFHDEKEDSEKLSIWYQSDDPAINEEARQAYLLDIMHRAEGH